jgi:branched-chain amino acid transport system ATP-binding protein
MLLEANNISKAFGSFRAVAGADLTVDTGDIIGLIGPNGAGKSTFFNCIAGDMPVTTGQIVFDSKDVTHHRKRTRSPASAAPSRCRRRLRT